MSGFRDGLNRLPPRPEVRHRDGYEQRVPKSTAELASKAREVRVVTTWQAERAKLQASRTIITPT